MSDTKIRRFLDYRIHARPATGPAIWRTPKGTLVTQAVAEARVREVLQRAKEAGAK